MDSLANQLAVAAEWEERQQALLVEDFWDEAAKAAQRAAGGSGAVISGAGMWPWLIGVGVAVTATPVGVVAYRVGRQREE